MVCPHAVIRPFLFNKQETLEGKKHSEFVTRKAKGENTLSSFNYSIFISP